MLNEFSIEMAAARIVDVRCRSYFEEVYRSYTAGNYRSAVVMLWSVVVCDMLFKLESLKNMYADSVATDILNEVEALRKTKPYSPEWEDRLLELVRSKTRLLDQAEHSNLQHLHTHRHLSAHPVITNADVLYSPNRDLTRAHIRNALEATLTKPAIMTKKVFDTFVEDIEANAALFIDDATLRAYLEHKYFPHFILPVEEGIFKNLWRLVFKSVDPRCEQNRQINFRVLCNLFERHPKHFSDLISHDSEWFSELTFDGTPVEAIFDFSRMHPHVYRSLANGARAMIDSYAKSDSSRNACAWFLHESTATHIEAVHQWVMASDFFTDPIRGTAYAELWRESGTNGKRSLVVEIAIKTYANSGSYDRAAQNFRELIRTYVEEYSKDQLLELVAAIEGNDQTYDRRAAARDHAIVKRVIDRVIGSSFDAEAYPCFMFNLPDIIAGSGLNTVTGGDANLTVTAGSPATSTTTVPPETPATSTPAAPASVPPATPPIEPDPF
jgi:hypothetical protein